MKPTPTPLTLGDIARYCHVDRVTVQRWVKNNFIPAYRTPGGHYLVPKDVFRKFLQKNNMPIFQEFFDDLSIRVLIADTPLDEAETLANFLRHAQMGYEIRTCSTGRETLLLWGIYQPDIVVLNVDLDGLGGPGVCGDAKKMFGDGLVHIVAISSDVQIGRASCRERV